MIDLSNYFYLSAIIFTIGLSGILLHQQNIIGILISLEVMLLGVCINFIANAVYLKDYTGEIFALMIITVAAAESAIGLAIVVLYRKKRGNIAIDFDNEMRG